MDRGFRVTGGFDGGEVDPDELVSDEVTRADDVHLQSALRPWEQLADVGVPRKRIRGTR